MAEYSGAWQTNIEVEGATVATVDSANHVTYLALSMLKTTKMTVNDAGSASGMATYYPYGAENASITVEYKFTNQIRDPNGIDHFWMRSYSATLGRWLTPDPAGLAAVDPSNPQSWNRYAYVLNNPASALDPLGLEGMTCHGSTSGIMCDSELNQAYAKYSASMSEVAVTDHGITMTFANWDSYANWATGWSPSAKAYQKDLQQQAIEQRNSALADAFRVAAHVSGTDMRTETSVTATEQGGVWTVRINNTTINLGTLTGFYPAPDFDKNFHHGAKSYYDGSPFGMRVDHAIDGATDPHAKVPYVEAHIDTYAPFNPLHLFVQVIGSWLGYGDHRQINAVCSATGCH